MGGRYDINKLMNPESICVIGATENSLFVRNLVTDLKLQGYGGKLSMVNPKYKTVFDHPCYPSVLEVPENIDNAMLLLPAGLTLNAVKECARKGVKSMTLITSGFAENGRKQGTEIQRQIKEIAEKSNIALCGPNCFGTISSHGQVANFCEKLPGKLGKGNIGIVMQSGGLMNSSVNLAYLRGVDFSYCVSSGNEAVLESSDYLRFLCNDPHTDVLCAFIEGVQDQAKFREVADLALEKGKPIIVIKIGRSSEGSEAAFRHTGSLTGSDEEFGRICSEKGIIRVDDLDELIETASLFSKVSGKWPQVGRRLGVITVSGGGASLIADLGSDEGFEFPKLAEEAIKKLSEIVPQFGFVANPLDMTAQVFGTPSKYIECAEHLINQPQLDIIFFAWTLGIPREPSHPVAKVLEGLSQLVKRTKKMCVLYSLANMGLSEWGKDFLRTCDMPLMQGGKRPFKAINALIRYTEILQRRKGPGV